MQFKPRLDTFQIEYVGFMTWEADDEGVGICFFFWGGGLVSIREGWVRGECGEDN